MWIHLLRLFSSIRIFCATWCWIFIYSFCFSDFSILIFCDIDVMFLEGTILLNSFVDVSYFLFSIFYKFSCSFATIIICCCTIFSFNFFKFISWLIYLRCFVFFSNITSYNWSVICKVCRNYISFFIFCLVNVVFLEGTCFNYWFFSFCVDISFSRVFPGT